MPERAIDNEGERLVPGESHSFDEVIRHKSSYQFFKAVILADVGAGGAKRPRILDLGCGVGHGSLTLAGLDGSEVVGVDASSDAIEYAQRTYAATNVTYVTATAESYLPTAQSFDYVVSRHALEHIPDGLRLALRFPCKYRLMVNVPYLEPARDEEGRSTNPHHALSNISEADFAEYPQAEFFFEDMKGVTTVTSDGANSIVCVSSAPHLRPASSLLSLPVPAWKPDTPEEIALHARYMESTIGTQAAQIDGLRTGYDSLARAYAELASAYDELANSRFVKAGRITARMLRRSGRS
jgi:SAM-dependent methyltransferase